MIFIKELKDIRSKDVILAGGKGASLGEMTQAGIPVPEGFVVLSTTFDKFIEEKELSKKIEEALTKADTNDTETIENASKKIQAMILKAEMPSEIKSEIEHCYKRLRLEYVAVRSSATSEDSSSDSWAGQLDSYLNTNQDTLIKNIQKCWASLFTPRAIVYRIEKNLKNKKISVAVVVQKMVESDVAGISFSIHPVTKNKNNLIIEAGFGLGEAVVSGQITPDSYIVDKKELKILEKNISSQERGLYRAKDGGNSWKSVKEKNKQKLPDDKILELSKLIIKIENHYNFSVDIEWAMENKKLYILQSRPITTFT